MTHLPIENMIFSTRPHAGHTRNREDTIDKPELLLVGAYPQWDMETLA